MTAKMGLPQNEPSKGVWTQCKTFFFSSAVLRTNDFEVHDSTLNILFLRLLQIARVDFHDRFLTVDINNDVVQGAQSLRRLVS